MNRSQLRQALQAATDAAMAAGGLMNANRGKPKKVDSAEQFDIKLRLDVECQEAIEASLEKSLPGIPVLGEEGESPDLDGDVMWVVDPIDGTVNFAHEIPHCCTSIALQQRTSQGEPETLVGVVYDPFQQELWTAAKGQKARLNGKPISVSSRRKLSEALVTIGFSKSKETLDRTLPLFNRVVYKIRKFRMMGSAALALTYVATGRLDAYIEKTVNLWDIAAGTLIVQQAGGEIWQAPIPGRHKYQLIASNGHLRKKLLALEP